MALLGSYLELFKTRQTLLLLFTGIVAYLEAADAPDPGVLALFTAATFLAICGTTGISMVLDSDIDAIMLRTRRRPIPSGRLKKKSSLIISLVLAILGLALTLLINAYIFGAGLMGLLINTLLYVKLLKRRYPTSVVFGVFAGGMPALGGWAAAMGSFGTGGILLMLLVAVWSSLHIWTLAIYYDDDYRKAGVPMLPVVVGEKLGALASVLAGCVVGLITAMLPAFNLVDLSAAILSELPLLGAISLLVSGLLRGNVREKSYKAFKLASAYMIIVFASITLT